MKKVKDKFVPPKESFKIKELGFNEECICWYSAYYSTKEPKLLIGTTKTFRNLLRNDMYTYEFNILNCTAPLWQDAFDWFSDTFDLRTSFPSNSPICYDYVIATSNCMFKEDAFEDEDEHYVSLYDAQLACIRKLIEVVESKNITNDKV